MTDIKKSFCSYKGMTQRNVKVYAKDKMAIILSMLTPIIVLGLYLLFLKDTYTDTINHYLTGLESFVSNDDINSIVNTWLLAGVLGTSVVTVALNSLSVMVSDKQNKIDFDYNATPLKGHTVVLSYFTGALINTFIVSAILLGAGFVFLAVSGTFYYSFTDIMCAFGIVALGSISATLILMLVASFFKKSSTLSSFGVLVSAAIGFVIGAYIPVSQFSDEVQNVVNLVPGSQIAGLLRNTLMSPVLSNIDSAIGGVDNGAFCDNMKNTFALNLNIFGESKGVEFMLIFSLIAIAVFFVLNLVLYKASSERKD